MLLLYDMIILYHVMRAFSGVGGWKGASRPRVRRRLRVLSAGRRAAAFSQPASPSTTSWKTRLDTPTRPLQPPLKII